MRLRHLPQAKRCRFIQFGPDINTPLDLRQQRGKIEIHGRHKNRIAAKNEQRCDRSGGHIAPQFTKRCQLVRRPELDRLGVKHGLPDISQMIVQPMTQRMHCRRLRLPGHHDALAAIAFQILHERGQPRIPFSRRRT